MSTPTPEKVWIVWDRDPEPGFENYTYVRYWSWEPDDTLQFPVTGANPLIREVLTARFPEGCKPVDAEAAVKNLLQDLADVNLTIAHHSAVMNKAKHEFKSRLLDEVRERHTQKEQS